MVFARIETDDERSYFLIEIPCKDELKSELKSELKNDWQSIELQGIVLKTDLRSELKSELKSVEVG